MANETTSTPSTPRSSANIWLALVAGLAVGFAVGREMGARSAGSASDEAAAPKPAVAAAGAKYKSEAQFPAGWFKSADLASVAGVSFAGLSDGQKAVALQALNERRCECGCGMESIAKCSKEDKHCPKSPKLVKDVVDIVKQGKGLADVYAYLDRENKGSGGSPQAQAPAPPAGPKKVPIPAHSPRKGPKNTKVTIVAFSDFQCPFCSRAVPVLKEIEENYPKDVAVVFVNQPLSFHDKAMGAAQAFMAAARQNKAWEMHDKMFANQQALAPTDLERYAQELGLNMARYKKDFDDPKIKTAIAADQALAGSVGANGTPTFMINGREVVGAQPFPTFKAVIDEEIKKADELLKKGTKPEDLYTKLMEQAAAAPPPAPGPAPGEKVDVSPGDAPSRGPKNAPVTIVAFSDFQCPFCSRVLPTVKQVEDTYKGKVRLAFKQLPLPFHPNAEIAAQASLAAHEQGKFWEMHDKMFANQQSLDRPNLERYAEELKLNMPRFKAALDSGKYKEKVQKDAADGNKIGATGTPTFFVNGIKVEGAVPFENFKTVIDAELAKAK
jgi:protein-disulfide isomerase